MEFSENHVYHVYNRGNNQQTIFHSPANYIFFLHKVRKYISPVCDMLNYCLMPNHFHFLIYANATTIQFKKTGFQERNVLSEGFRKLLSNYSQAINEQEKTTGSLFQQNTKSKCVSNGSFNCAPICFHYIHQNPHKAGLVKRMEHWKYSSFKDYAGLRNGTLCNQQLASALIDLNKETFYHDSYQAIETELYTAIH